MRPQIVLAHAVARVPAAAEAHRVRALLVASLRGGTLLLARLCWSLGRVMACCLRQLLHTQLLVCQSLQLFCCLILQWHASAGVTLLATSSCNGVLPLATRAHAVACASATAEARHSSPCVGN